MYPYLLPSAFLYLISSYTLAIPAPFLGEDVSQWLRMETSDKNSVAYRGLLANIHPPSTVPGVVIASPSNQVNATDNNYFFHWKRDSALTMDVVNSLYAQRDPE